MLYKSFQVTNTVLALVCKNLGECSFDTHAVHIGILEAQRYSRSLQWVPVYDVIEQSQVKFSHCWIHTPMLAHESSWQVVLGPGTRRVGRRKKEIPQVHSQATLRERHCSESKQCRTHAEEMHSRKTRLHHVALEERTRSQQCHHRKPDLEYSSLKSCLKNPVSCWVKRQMFWHSFHRINRTLVKRRMHKHIILRLETAVQDASLTHWKHASADELGPNKADVMALSTSLNLLISGSVCGGGFACNFYHSDMFQKKFYQSKT